MKHPVRVALVQERTVTTYRCSGTPADCVIVGAFDLCGGLPTLVVSGINRGANIGDDLNYSGTVAAAVESVIIGIPSLAVSLAASWPEHARDHQWATAANVAVRHAREVLANGLPRTTFLNINVPNLPESELRGDRWVRQGRKAYRERVDRRSDPRGGTYYWLGGTFDASSIVDGTDLGAVRDNFVSVTPISIDRTDHDELGRRLRSENVRAGPRA
jgi:5'-nucleotidase